MHAMIVGTISDFPARGMLSGKVVRGYKACPECLSSQGCSNHCNKIVWMGHRAYLPHDHPWQIDTGAFDGTEERGVEPHRWSGEEILAVLDEYDFGQLSNHPLQMDMIKSDDNPNWSHELLLLAMQPQRARVYPTCTVNGVKFVSEERYNRRRTQNSGVMAKGHGLDYYGVLHSVVELVYAEGMKVHLFKCRWFDTGAQSMKMDQYGNLSVNTATSAYEDDPFVFATTVKQVFYLDDLAKGDAWKIANIVHPRNIYRAATLGVTIPGPEADAYQEPNAVGIHDVATVRDNNVKHGRVLRIRDEDSTFIDVDPNEETNDDSDDELRHRLPDINSDTEEDSSDDSDYEP
ncbi:hypothetical protein ACLB2K_029728 [Fragaria x ananassa]